MLSPALKTPCRTPFVSSFVSSPSCVRKASWASTPQRRVVGSAKKLSQAQADRFIPNRSLLNMEDSDYQLLKENNGDQISPSKAAYQKRLAEGLGQDPPARILAFKNKAPAPPEGHMNNLLPLYTQNTGPNPARKAYRHLPQAPERILDAPDLLDDYYLNLLDWSSQNTVAIALGNTAYLWNASDGTVQPLTELSQADDYITSIAWAADGKHLSVGTASAQVQIWDVDRKKQIRSLRGHSARVTALAWNNTTLSSGGRDSVIQNHDVRQRESIFATLRGHEQEVCGLKWSPNGQQLASGGNDNLLHIWQLPSDRPLHRIASHTAAVKALAWCPFQANLLASGGGTADRTIKFWNTHTGACLNSIDTNSQVCALQWNRHDREILSSHGFSQNQLCLWKYPSMVKVAEFTGHTSRVLHLAQSPDGTTVVSGAADETLRFWRCFAEPVKTKAKEDIKTSSILRSVTLRVTNPQLVFLKHLNGTGKHCQPLPEATEAVSELQLGTSYILSPFRHDSVEFGDHEFQMMLISFSDQD